MNECDHYRQLEETAEDYLPEPLTDYDIEMWEAIINPRGEEQ